jgi:hypothetical protein
MTVAEGAMRLAVLVLSIFAGLMADTKVHSQTAKKGRMGIQSTNVGFLPFHVAYHKDGPLVASLEPEDRCSSS